MLALLPPELLVPILHFLHAKLPARAPKGAKAVATNVGNIGDVYDGADFLTPPQVRAHWSLDQLVLALNNLTTKLLREPRDFVRVRLGDSAARRRDRCSFTGGE